jgi:hypothetical protein
VSDPEPHSIQGKTWRINTPDVSSELIGKEVVAIHLPTGLYYSIENVAAAIWTRIEGGFSYEQIVGELTTAYDVDAAKAKPEATAFLADLLKEKLIVEAEGGKAAATSSSGEKQPYITPVLEKFPDLQDLLMIDPIHEVDERGWPHTKPD